MVLIIATILGASCFLRLLACALKLLHGQMQQGHENFVSVSLHHMLCLSLRFIAKGLALGPASLIDLDYILAVVAISTNCLAKLMVASENV